MRKAIFFDVSPLQEYHFTGIANVTAALASRLLNYKSADVYFFNGLYIIEHDAILLSIQSQSGALLRWHTETSVSPMRWTRVLASQYDMTIGLFPNVKTLLGAFTKDVQIVHDITFIITPEFHHPDTINYHGGTILRDLNTNAFTFTDSDCTRSDVMYYFGVDGLDIGTAYPGVDAVTTGIQSAETPTWFQDFRYIVVPGTIEPRKNASLVLKYLSRNHDFFDKRRVVFFGRQGWLVSFKSLIMEYGLGEHVENGNIIWLDFVNIEARDIIYRNADWMVFPSLYEGFGLPVGEAMSQGCPVCASYSSSIPEVGGEAAIYFDPLDVDSLKHAIDTMRNLDASQSNELKCKSKAQVKRFTWDAFTSKILAKCESLLDINHE